MAALALINDLERPMQPYSPTGTPAAPSESRQQRTTSESRPFTRPRPAVTTVLSSPVTASARMRSLCARQPCTTAARSRHCRAPAPPPSPAASRPAHPDLGFVILSCRGGDKIHAFGLSY